MLSKWLEGGRLDTSRGSRFMRGDTDLASEVRPVTAEPRKTVPPRPRASGTVTPTTSVPRDGEPLAAHAFEPRQVKAALPLAAAERRNVS